MFVDFVGITDRSVVFSELLMVAGVFFLQLHVPRINLRTVGVLKWSGQVFGPL